MQLVWGILVSVTFLCLRFEAQPYRSSAADHVAFSVDVLLVMVRGAIVRGAIVLEPWYASCWPATMTTCTPGRAASMLRSSWFHAPTVRASCSCAVSRAPLAGLSLPRLWPESSVVRV